MLANWPWTILVINPVNAVLMATESSQAGAETRTLIEKCYLWLASRTDAER